MVNFFLSLIRIVPPQPQTFFHSEVSEHKISFVFTKTVLLLFYILTDDIPDTIQYIQQTRDL